MYPQYYTNTFHYQGDGWFSDSSARVYEHSTEVLFFGRQDAMQRTTLLPVAEYMQASGKRQEDVRLLEVAAGEAVYYKVHSTKYMCRYLHAYQDISNHIWYTWPRLLVTEEVFAMYVRACYGSVVLQRGYSLGRNLCM